MLFLTYLNDFHQLISYADDTVLFIKHKDWVQLQKIVEDDFQAVKTWLDCIKLCMNPTKTFFLIFTVNKCTQPQFDSLTVHNLTCKINGCNCVDTIKKQNNAK